MVDIISRLIYKGCVPDNEEGQSLCKLNVMEWSRVLCIVFSVYRLQLLNLLLYT